MVSPFETMLAQNFLAIGDDAVYTPLAGAPVTLKVQPRRPDSTGDLTIGEPVRSKAVFFDVLADKVPAPQKGATVTHKGQNYTVIDWFTPDGDRLLRTLECAGVA